MRRHVNRVLILLRTSGESVIHERAPSGVPANVLRVVTAEDPLERDVGSRKFLVDWV